MLAPGSFASVGAGSLLPSSKISRLVKPRSLGKRVDWIRLNGPFRKVMRYIRGSGMTRTRNLP